MTFLAFLLALGSALRLTRLAVTDSITQPIRTAIAMRYAASSALESQTIAEIAIHDATMGRLGGRPDSRTRSAHRRARAWLFAVQLFECPWCIGFWISLAVATIAVSPLGSSTPALLAGIALSLSWLVGALAFLEATIEDIHRRLD